LLSELSQFQEQEKEANKLVSAEIKVIEFQRDRAIVAVKTEFDNLLDQAKSWVAAIGETVKGQHYQMIFSRRYTWNIPGILEHIESYPKDEFSRCASKNIREQQKVNIKKAY
jgi:hypothetical protein